jgi:hypothetical protein
MRRSATLVSSKSLRPITEVYGSTAQALGLPVLQQGASIIFLVAGVALVPTVPPTLYPKMQA